MKKKSKSVFLILFLMAVVALLAYPKLKTAGKTAGTPPGPPRDMQVEVAAYEVKPERMDEVVFSTGTVLADEEIELRNEVAGVIRRVHFREGGKVSKGDLLVKLNDEELQAQLSKVKHRLKLAEENEYRMRRQLELEAISRRDFDLALNELHMAQAELRLLTAQIEKTEIRAPFSGVVGLKHVSEGSFLTPGTKITTLQSMDPIKVDFSVPEKYAGAVRKGQKIRFRAQGSDKSLEGEVYAMEPRIDPATRTLQLRAVSRDFGESVPPLPGAFAQVEFLLGANDSALFIPTGAITSDGQGQSVFLIRDGIAVPRKVEVGIRTADRIRILGGLSPGDTVVASGIMSMRPRTAVKISRLD